MPQEPTTTDLTVLVQRGVDAAYAPHADAPTSLGAPDGVWDLSPVGLGIYRGRAAIRDFYERYWATFEDHGLDLEEAQDLGRGVTLADEARAAAERLVQERG